METRKLQKLGASSYFITLPKEWVEKAGLKPGDKINVVEEESGCLRILPTTHRSKVLKILSIDCTKLKHLEKLASTILTCGYILGFDAIEFSHIKELPPPLLKSIERALPTFMGMVTIDQTRNSVVTECVIDSSKIDSTNILKRMLSIVVDTLMDLTIKNLECREGKGEVPDTIIVELRKLHNLVMRTLISERSRVESSRNYTIYFIAAALFEMIIDFMLSAASASTRVESSINAEVVEEVKRFYNESSEAITDSILALVNNSFQRAKRAIEKCRFLESKVVEVLGESLKNLETPLEKAIVSTVFLKAADSVRISQVIANMAICSSMLSGSEWAREKLGR